MIDLHCHILPGLDDGAADLQESLAMAHLALEDGISTIVATPHSLDGMYVNTSAEISRAAESLRAALSEHRMGLKICLGADVHLCPDLVQKIKEGTATTINESGKYILLELPPQTVPSRIKDEIFALKLLGITPIITHPERHPVMQRDSGKLIELISLGALVQITAMSITGEFGLPVMECAQAMLEQRMVHVIASDAHSPQSRPPLLSRALEAAGDILCSAEEAEKMVDQIPAAILAGMPVEVPVPEPVKKSHHSRRHRM